MVVGEWHHCRPCSRFGLDQIDDAITIHVSRRTRAARSAIVRETVEVLPVNEVGLQSMRLDTDCQLIPNNREPGFAARRQPGDLAVHRVKMSDIR
jgi:hypothetical protein